MKSISFPCLALLVACGGDSTDVVPDALVDGGGGGADTSIPKDGGGNPDGSNPGKDSSSGCGTCPTTYTCGSANGLPVCRAPSGVPLFSKVIVIMMENTTQATLQAQMSGSGAPYFASMKTKYATGLNYHGVAHPSLGNYIALTSGDTQGIACDCKPDANQGTCNLATCNLVIGSCSCNQAVSHLGDQIDTAKRSWSQFSEDMGTPCSTTDTGGYVARHVPFLYYDNVRNDATRCAARIVDFTKFDPNKAPDFSLIAPNLVHDMHDPFPASATNIANGDKWIAPQVEAILQSTAYTSGGLLVVVWDEDDASGGLGGSDDPVPIFVLSPFAKSGGYTSALKADHYSLLATIEDGMGLPRLAKAAKATPLADYFPAN